MGLGIEFSNSFYIDPPDAGSKGHHLEYPLFFPLPDLGGVYTPFQDVEIDYNPLGHPNTPYARPHIVSNFSPSLFFLQTFLTTKKNQDFHFYLQNRAARAEIESGVCGEEEASSDSFCESVTPFPSDDCYPPAYFNPGIVKPGMGAHLLDGLGPELQPGATFYNTMVFGAYQGRITFFEPKVTNEAFEAVMNGTWPKTCFNIRTPKYFKVPGYYPTSYCFFYLPTGNFRLELNQFQPFSANCDQESVKGGPGSYYPKLDPGITKEKVKKCRGCPWYNYKDLTPIPPPPPTV